MPTAYVPLDTYKDSRVSNYFTMDLQNEFYKVGFLANSAIAPQVVRNFALHRAAEVTLKSGTSISRS